LNKGDIASGNRDSLGLNYAFSNHYAHEIQPQLYTKCFCNTFFEKTNALSLLSNYVLFLPTEICDTLRKTHQQYTLLSRNERNPFDRRMERVRTSAWRNSKLLPKEMYVSMEQRE